MTAKTQVFFHAPIFSILVKILNINYSKAETWVMGDYSARHMQVNHYINKGRHCHSFIPSNKDWLQASNAFSH